MWRTACQRVDVSVHALVWFVVPKDDKTPRQFYTIGTAFCVSQNPPVFLTAAHVIAEASGTVRMLVLALLPPGGGQAVAAKLKLLDLTKEKDLAIIEASSDAAFVPPVTFGPRDILPIG